MIGSEEKSSGWEKLLLHERGVINELHSEGLYMYLDDEDAHRLVDILQSRNQIPKKLQKVSEHLAKYQVSPVDAKNRRVIEAWQILNKFAEMSKSDSDKLGLVTVVFGSMVYDDPVNLDYDICVFSEGVSEPELKDLSNKWEETLNADWRGDHGYVSYIDLNTISETVNQFSSGREDVFSEALSLYDQSLLASTILTGRVLYSPTPDLPIRFRSRVADYCSVLPLFGAMIIKEIEDTIKIREERRKK